MFRGAADIAVLNLLLIGGRITALEAVGVLEKSLRATGLMLTDDEDDIRSSEGAIDLESIELPESLRDPMETLRRGQEILKHGFSTYGDNALPAGATSRHLEQAARNGQGITGDLRERMHQDRSVARDEKKKA